MIARQSDKNFVVGLDIGTTKICTVVGEVVGDTVQIRGVSTSASYGLRKGVVINIESTVESVKNAVKKAGSITDTEINAVYVGISAAHIKGIHGHGAVGIRGKEVSYTDVERVMDSAKNVHIPLDREVLHTISAGYTLDGQNSIKNPIGMVGTRLDGKIYIITAAVTPVQNVLKCCEEAGLDVLDIIFEPLASAEAVLTDEEKEMGVAFLDIGGGTTDIMLYKNGWLRHTSVLSIGGNHFTNDIAVGLRVSISEAERLKKSFGSLLTGSKDDHKEIDIIQEGKSKKIPVRCLTEIIQPRAEELVELIRSELISSSGYDIASAGVVLTGGCCLLKGLDRMAEKALGLPVRVGFPKRMNGNGDISDNPMYSTGVGLVLYGLEEDTSRIFDPVTVTGVFGKMKDWVNGIFK